MRIFFVILKEEANRSRLNTRASSEKSESMTMSFRSPNPRIAREFLLNIGTIVSEGFVDVLLKRRRLGSVEENFIKQLQIGDLFVLAGRVVRLIDTGVNEAYVERADGHLPTIPRWNAAKMPLTSGLARAVRQLRSDLARQMEKDEPQLTDWLVENYHLSKANAEAIVRQFCAQLSYFRNPRRRANAH